MAKGSFQVIQGGVGSGPGPTYVDTGVVNEKGQPVLRPVGPDGSAGDGGGGDDMTPLWKLDVPRDVQIAKWGLASLLTLVGIFFWFVYLPDLKEVRRDIGGINTNVAVQAKSVGDIEKTLDRIEGKIDRDHQPEAGPPAGEAGGVHQGAGSGKRP